MVAHGSVRLHDADGSLLWGPIALPGSDPEAGGAPTIGDFDGDGEPEIGVAGSDVYVVFDGDGSILWQASTQDHTSNLTGSTSFDFDGDGSLEIVYRDERRLRIYRGADGAVLFELTVSSNTWTEEPVVADVDRDGNAEIVVTSDRAPDVAIPAGERTFGLYVLGDSGDGWVSARGLWNQHAYTPDQIDDDGGIPPNPAWGWLVHNTFRANLPPGGDPHAAPDLTSSRLEVDLSALPALGITARIGNGGRLPVAPGLPVAFYAGDPDAGGVLLGVAAVPSRLEPGGFVDLSATFVMPSPPLGVVTVVADDDGAGGGRERECDETNNRASLGFDTTALGLWITVDDGTTSVGAGDETTYTITVHNAFAATATGVAIADELPAGALFVAASDGATENLGVVEWPEISLAAGTWAVRTLTVQVDPDLPLAVTSITNRASVTDDGALGPDPTPGNNVAVDVDQVTTVTADAGGPYFAPEGATVTLDGSASFDRDGTIVAHLWDLDGDGVFDDASGALVPWLPPGEGIYAIRLRVTDDSGQSDEDSTTAEIGNEPPVVDAPASLSGVEGSPVSLSAVTATDPGDELAATVDWGDGLAEPVAVVAGALAGEHAYADDGIYSIGVCVSDGTDEVCLDIVAQIANAAPEVHEVGGFDFDGWIAEELGSGGTTAWSISTGGRTATELLNGGPSFFVGDLPAFGNYEIGLRVADPGDDDFLGLALGFEPGDTLSPSADYLLVDWKRHDQDGARSGLALSRVRGVPAKSELWLHVDQAANGTTNGVTELARATNLGAVGWARHTEYRFRLEHTPTRLRLWVDGALELDLVGTFPAGRLALYDYSQANAVFTAIESAVSVSGFEGVPATLRATFTDPGIADLHTGTILWGDGAIESAALTEESGAGEVVASHVYRDDGTPPLSLCVADDEGAEDCAAIPAQIANLPPQLALALASTGFVEDSVSLAGSSFVDPGVLDSHSATVDWGDATQEPAAIDEADGAGTVTATHLYAEPGTYVVVLCVEDDDGGEACADRSVSLVLRSLDLALTKSVDRPEARPGEPIEFTLTIENEGTLPATGVLLTDLLPEHVAFVSASDGGSQAGGIVTWSVEDLEPGAMAQRRVACTVALDAPFGGAVVNLAAVTDDGSSGLDGDPTDNQALATIRFSDGVTPIVRLPGALGGTEGATLALAGATWEDTTAGETHSGTIDWGDGTVGGARARSVERNRRRDLGATPLPGGRRLHDRGLRHRRGVASRAAPSTSLASRQRRARGARAGERRSRITGSRRSTGNGPVPPNWVVAADGLSVEQLDQQPALGLRQPGARLRQRPRGSPSDRRQLGRRLRRLRARLHAGRQHRIRTPSICWSTGSEADQGRSPPRPRALARGRHARRPSSSGVISTTPSNGPDHRVEELARGFVPGDSGWTLRPRLPLPLRVFADPGAHLGRRGLWSSISRATFPAGNFGFYNYSQQEVTYRGFVVGAAQQFEGEMPRRCALPSPTRAGSTPTSRSPTGTTERRARSRSSSPAGSEWRTVRTPIRMTATSGSTRASRTMKGTPTAACSP